MTWNIAQIEVLYPAALLGLVLLPLVVSLGQISLSRLAGWQRVLSLAVRCLVLTLLVLALCGIRWITTTNEPFVVFVIDLSRSVSANGHHSTTRFIANATESIPEHQWRVSAYSDSPELKRGQYAPRRFLEHTEDMAVALESGSAWIPPGYVPRIVLLSDGNASRESALIAARSLDVPIDTIPLPSLSYSEVYVSDIVAPSAMPVGLPFDIEVILQATRAGQGVVTLKNAAESEERNVTVHAGENRVRFRRWLASENAAVFTATVSEFDDTIADNNSRSVVVAPRGRARVLIVETEPGSTARIQKILEDLGTHVQLSPPQQFPKERETLGDYHLIVVSNVAPNMFTDEQQAALEQFVKDGGGLIAIGGDQAFHRQSFADSTLERILPVKSLEAERAAQTSMAMVLVIDRSKSMDPEAGQTVDKMALAKQAANLAVNILQPTDKVGVITFSDNTRWVSDLAPVADTRRLKRAIDSIVAEGGTNMFAALDKAYLALRRADAKLKHVIVLTDGISVPGDFESIATRMADEGITVSTVAIGDKVTDAVLKDISSAGRGRHYVCENPDDLPAIVAGETRSASETVASEQPFRSQMIHVPPRLATLEIDKAPSLAGYAETTPKRDAQLVLTSETGDPLLAWWRYGRGTAVAFTSDAELRWAKKWTEWPGYDNFWRELAHQAMRPARNNRVATQVVSQGKIARVIVDVTNEAGEFENGAVVTLRNNEINERRLIQTMPGRYEADVLADENLSVWKLSISSADSRTHDRSLGIISNYHEELKLKPTNTTLLSEIAKLSGGRYEVSADAVFDDDDRIAFRVVPLWPYFTVLALVAFVLDVTLRRVDFEQWFSKHKR